jgi:hypothetical protein
LRGFQELILTNAKSFLGLVLHHQNEKKWGGGGAGEKARRRPEEGLTGVSSTGKFLPNFDLKNMISTCTTDFSWKK